MIKTEPIDMSPRAVAARIEEMRQLYRLSVHLLKIGEANGLHRGLRASEPRDK
jgi:hypothetical protein